MKDQFLKQPPIICIRPELDHECQRCDQFRICQVEVFENWPTCYKCGQQIEGAYQQLAQGEKGDSCCKNKT